MHEEDRVRWTIQMDDLYLMTAEIQTFPRSENSPKALATKQQIVSFLKALEGEGLVARMGGTAYFSDMAERELQDCNFSPEISRHPLHV